MENNKTCLFENRLYWFYLIGFCLILALPLLNIAPWFSPANWGKTIVFRIILSVMAFGFLWSLLSREKSEIGQKIAVIRKSLVFKLLLSLLGVYFLATIFSQDPYFSFWNSPYRSGGFLNFSFYIFFSILVFLLLKKADWNKIWNFTLVIGFLVALIAIFQHFGLFSNILASDFSRPSSTTGAPSFLAIYLLLLSFLALVFGIQKKSKKSLFYLFCFILFLFIILLTATRAAFLGLFIGLLFFAFFFPIREFIDKRHWRKMTWLKAGLGIILILGAIGAYWLNSQSQIVESLEKNKFFGTGFSRAWSSIQPLLDIQNISFGKIASEGRYSGWKVAWQSVKEKPILGYGPENFSIGFDKYYDPAISSITREGGRDAGSGWWDRAHNFALEIAVCAGIPALIIYLLLFGALFERLQKLKHRNPSKAIIYHGIQASFIAYLIANFFSFDSYSSYIILFLLIGYCLHLISAAQTEQTC
ncbi:O-antigen ligase family protein [Candidatus Parcubacteria bacterium]|nr:O-antigen ligase family protein [Candidatus Parcubacteria bacterium]